MAAARGRFATIHEALAEDRRSALALVRDVGDARARKVLEASARDLRRRLKDALGEGGPGDGSFTATQLRTALAQVEAVLKTTVKGLRTAVEDGAAAAVDKATAQTAEFMRRADEQFRGVGVQPLALDEASMFERAKSGVESSILNRLTARGTKTQQAGVLARYGAETTRAFEEQLQLGVATGKSWEDMSDALTERSPFLQGKPGHWAVRIVRTEVMGAFNKAGLEAVKDADEQLDDMLKVLCASFDDRTGADSFAVHGQIRRPDEPFESWYGLYQHPPNRPNDREVVVPHRMSWPIPPYLAWRSPGEIAARWRKEGRKGPVPKRPLMTTVPLESIGRGGRESGRE